MKKNKSINEYKLWGCMTKNLITNMKIQLHLDLILLKFRNDPKNNKITVKKSELRHLRKENIRMCEIIQSLLTLEISTEQLGDNRILIFENLEINEDDVTFIINDSPLEIRYIIDYANGINDN